MAILIWGLRIVTVIVLCGLWMALLGHELIRRLGWDAMENCEGKAYG